MAEALCWSEKTNRRLGFSDLDSQLRTDPIVRDKTVLLFFRKLLRLKYCPHEESSVFNSFPPLNKLDSSIFHL
jgi:hypothetical protein